MQTALPIESMQRRAVAAALVFSLMLHLGLIWWFHQMQVGHLVIPAERERLRPLEIRQIEVPQEVFDTRPSPVLFPTRVELTTETPQSLKQEGVRFDPALLAQPISPVLPEITEGGRPELASRAAVPLPAFTPFNADAQARVQAELLERTQVGPRFPTLRQAAPELPGGLVPKATPGSPPGGSAGQATGGAGSRLPSLEEVQTQFRLTPPALTEALPQAVIVQMPSDVLFDFDSAALREDAKPALQQVVIYLQQYPKAEVDIEGHTDTFGEDAYNDRLSLARAEAVAQWLRPLLDPERFTLRTVGWGERRLIANPAGSKEEQERNRRVEFVVRALRP